MHFKWINNLVCKGYLNKILKIPYPAGYWCQRSHVLWKYPIGDSTITARDLHSYPHSIWRALSIFFSQNEYVYLRYKTGYWGQHGGGGLAN